MTKKYVYFFGKGKPEGKGDMKDLLGGKGANLAEMARLGLNVPPGFTISTEAYVYYFKNKNTLHAELWNQVLTYLKKLEKRMERKFGDPANPLLVSVRSGAAVSMPGMMDTVLNLGLNEDTVRGLAETTQNERFAFDCYRRFIAMFGHVVLGIPGEKFESILTEKKEKHGIESDIELPVEDLEALVKNYKSLVKKHVNRDFPTDPLEQLRMAIAAVFDSWNTERAIVYRRLQNIPDDLGTAVNVQSMVYGNRDNTSATGVAFTRDPATGENRFYEIGRAHV